MSVNEDVLLGACTATGRIALKKGTAVAVGGMTGNAELGQLAGTAADAIAAATPPEVQVAAGIGAAAGVVSGVKMAIITKATLGEAMILVSLTGGLGALLLAAAAGVIYASGGFGEKTSRQDSSQQGNACTES